MAKYTVNMLAKADTESVYAINTSINVSGHKRSSNVAFEIQFGSNIRSVIVHDSWVPQDLSMQAPKETILASPSFRESISRGLIELVADQEAEKILSDEDAVLEVRRIANKHNKVNQDIDAEPIMPKDIVVQKEAEDSNIAPMLRDLCIREAGEIEPVEVYSKLKSAEKTLSKEEYQYLNKNLPAYARNSKVDNLISTHLR